MNKIKTIFVNDIKHLFANKITTIFLLGLVLLPSIFTWYNIMACWNIFDNTGNLKVAVASVDEGYESDLFPLEVNIGETVISELRANDQIDWVFTSEEEALEGVRKGTYYAAVVIPQSFSKDMLSFYSDNGKKATIVYYCNEKINAISPRITDTGASSVSYQVNETFAETLSKISVTIAQSLSNYVDNSDASGLISQLSGNIRTTGVRMQQASSVMLLYADLASSTSALVSDSAKMLSLASEQLSNATEEIKEKTQEIESSGDLIESTTSNLSYALGNSASGLEALVSQIQNSEPSTREEQLAMAETLREEAALVQNESLAYSAMLSSLQEAQKQELANQDVSSAGGASGQVGAEGAAGQAGGQAGVPNLVSAYDSAIDSTQRTIQNLDSLQESLVRTASLLENNENANNEKAQLIQEAQDARDSILDSQETIDKELGPELEKLQEDCALLNESLGRAVEHLSGIADGSISSIENAGSDISAASSVLAGTAAEMQSMAGELFDLANAIDSALAAGDSQALAELLSSDSVDIASVLSAPVVMERDAVFAVENFGSGMAPLYTVIALFVGNLLIMVLLKPQVSGRCLQDLPEGDYKPRHFFFGRGLTVLCISFAQSTAMCLGNMFFLGVQVSDPWLYLLCFWVASFLFAVMAYTLVLSFANLGKAILVLLLIVQVTGCGGSYPLELLPDFVQALNPLLPATHVVDAMRSAMMGVYMNDYWIEIAILLAMTIPFWLLGLVLRKPTIRFMNWYVGKVEESKLIV
ncbi:MAG: YhgE/Pip family protein [Anaerotardibacter sp.]